MNNKELVKKFYTSFSNGNVEEMTKCYHNEIIFEDPVFGKLKGNEAVNMWKMLLSKRNDSTKITFENIEINKNKGSVTWIAKYLYGEKKRKVTNIVTANFKFKDGKIIEHIDSFNVWKWSKQALGLAGLLIGWTPLMKSKIQKITKTKLENFTNKK